VTIHNSFRYVYTNLSAIKNHVRATSRRKHTIDINENVLETNEIRQHVLEKLPMIQGAEKRV